MLTKAKLKVTYHSKKRSGCCRKFTEITKDLDFQLTFKTTDLQHFIYTSLAYNISMTINKLFLHLPIFIPSAETQAMIFESIKKNFRISFHSWYTDRKVVNDGINIQTDIGLAQSINSPKKLLAIHQFLAEIGVPNKANNLSVFDNFNVTK